RDRPPRSLGFGTRDDEQPDGAALGDRDLSDTVAKGEAILGGVHQRLPIPRRWYGVVGAWLGATRLDAEGRSDREPRAVARGGGRRLRAPGAVAMGARPSWPSPERVREPPRDVGGSQADPVGRAGRVGV